MPSLKEMLLGGTIELNGYASQCKECGQEGLEWGRTSSGKWILIGEENGVLGRHQCTTGKYAKKKGIQIMSNGVLEDDD